MLYHARRAARLVDIKEHLSARVAAEHHLVGRVRLLAHRHIHQLRITLGSAPVVLAMAVVADALERHFSRYLISSPVRLRPVSLAIAASASEQDDQHHGKDSMFHVPFSFHHITIVTSLLLQKYTKKLKRPKKMNNNPTFSSDISIPTGTR